MSDEPPPRLLVVGADEGLRNMLQSSQPGLEARLIWASSHQDARDELAAEPIDVVLTGATGLGLCDELRDTHPDVPTIVSTGQLEVAVDAVRAGAWDLLIEPLDPEIVRSAVERAVAHRRLGREVRQLRRRLRASTPIEGLVGESSPMRRLFTMMERVASVSSNVLLVGESGTGKERVAQALHRMGPRHDRPFVAINCAAVPESLLESELFGHVRGAFTDARTARTGLFVQASGGTLLLDEIGDMPTALQAKLLRVLQERRVRPLGSETEIAIDVRVMAATHQDLEQRVAQGRFRGDLLYRLDVIRLEVPPLRDRGTDVLLLAQQFLGTVAASLDRPVPELSGEAARRLVAHDWPGNVRELQNCIERAVVLAEHHQITVEDLPAALRRPRTGPQPNGAPPDSLVSLAEVEKRHILHVVQALGGNRSRAAEILGIDRKTLYRKLDRWARELAEPP